MGQLTEGQAVQVSAGLLCHYYYNKSANVLRALYAYAGVGYGGTDVPQHLVKPGSREAVVHGWLECEAYLQRRWTPPPRDRRQKKPEYFHDYEDDYPSFVKQALHKARPFELKNKEFDDRLFPKDPVTGQWRPQRTPGWMTDYFKTLT